MRIVCFGHIGDGNLHYNQSKADAESNAAFIARTAAVNRIVHDLVHELGGSISAEHGLGQLKRDEVLRYKSGTEMDMMRAVKQALDPRGLMNPGKLLCKNRLGGFTLRPRLPIMRALLWGYSSAGRALAWHARGPRFDPAYLHQTISPYRLEA